MNDFNSFRKLILNVTDTRKHKVNKSIGVYDIYKYIRKNKWFNIGRPLTEHEFYSIIRTINNYLSEELLKGNDITLPCNMGRLEIRKRKTNITIKDGKIKTDLPIDWDRTIKLWYQDLEALENKTLIKVEEKEVFRIYWNRMKCNCNNKGYYLFSINRDIKRKLKKQIKEGHIDAFIFND